MCESELTNLRYITVGLNKTCRRQQLEFNFHGITASRLETTIFSEPFLVHHRGRQLNMASDLPMTITLSSFAS